MDRIGAWVAQEGILWSTEKGRAKVTQNVRAIRHAIETNLEMCEKALPILKDFLKVCGQKVWQDSDIEMLRQRSKKFTDDTIKLDYDRGSDAEMRSESMAYLKFRMNKVFNRADLKKDEDGDVAALMQDCSKDGKFGQTYDRLLKAYQDLQDDFKAIANKYGSNSINQEMLYGWAREYDFFAQQLMMTHSDTKVVTKGFKPSKVLEGYLDPQQRATLNTALEMAFAMEAEEVGISKLKGSKKAPFEAVRAKVSSATKAFFTKLKNLVRHQNEDEPDTTAEATELFGFGKRQSTSGSGNDHNYNVITGVADYIMQHFDQIEKGLAKGDYLLYKGCDAAIEVLAVDLKGHAWKNGVYLLMLVISQQGKSDDKAPVVCFFQNAQRQIVSIGYCTVSFAKSDLETFRSKKENTDITLFYHPLWEADTPDAAMGSLNSVMPICSANYRTR